jgi:carbamoyl-phosphate synthase large subunit
MKKRANKKHKKATARRGGATGQAAKAGREKPRRSSAVTRSSRRQATGKRSGAQTVRILFTCVGRRIELIRAFRRAAEAIGVRLEVHGADASEMSPGFHMVDKPHLVPKIASGQYIDALIQLARSRGISLLVPLIDTELLEIARARDRFAEAGCMALISAPGVVEICRNKLETYRTLREAGVDTPQTWPSSEVVAWPHHDFPYFVKPRAGSAAKGSHIVNDLQELQTFVRLADDAIVQEFVHGVEHTLDVYTGFDGVPRCVVARRRLEVRTGEVSKSLVVKDDGLMAVGIRVTEVLRECRGVVTVQCIATDDRRIRVIEINPRFGGGVPLAIHAGADFPKWILQELLGQRPRINALGYQDDIAMLRFDDSVFVKRASRYLTDRASSRV